MLHGRPYAWFALALLMFEGFISSICQRGPGNGHPIFQADLLPSLDHPLDCFNVRCSPQVSTLQTLSEQRSLHLLPALEHLPLEHEAWTSQIPDISVLECYADMAMHGFLTKSMQSSRHSFPAALASHYLHTACFSEEQGQFLLSVDHLNPHSMDLCPTRHASKDPLEAAFIKPSANDDVQDSLLSKLQGMRERLELGCPLDVLQQVKGGSVDHLVP